jgi:hypothetical protein
MSLKCLFRIDGDNPYEHISTQIAQVFKPYIKSAVNGTQNVTEIEEKLNDVESAINQLANSAVQKPIKTEDDNEVDFEENSDKESSDEDQNEDESEVEYEDEVITTTVYHSLSEPRQTVLPSRSRRPDY